MKKRKKMIIVKTGNYKINSAERVCCLYMPYARS